MGYLKKHLPVILLLCSLSAGAAENPLPGALEKQSALATPNSISLTTEEIAWLNDHPVITSAISHGWAPIEFLSDDLEFRGISIDYLKRLETLLGIRFQKIRSIENPDIEQADMLTAVTNPNKTTRFTPLDKPYLDMPLVIFAKEDTFGIHNLEDLYGKKVAVFKTGAAAKSLARDHPEINLYRVDLADEALAALATGKVDAYIGNLVVISYVARNQGIGNLKIVGETPYHSSVYMAVRNDWPQLGPILQKGLQAISEEERNAISRNWVAISYETRADYRLLWIIGGVSLTILVLFGFWNWRHRAIERKRAERELRLTQAAIDKSQSAFYRLSASGKVLYVNDYACQSRGYQREEMVGKNVWEFDPDFPAEAWPPMWEGLKKNGVVHIETRHRRKDGTVFPVHVTGNYVVADDDEYSFTFVQDITERKRIERDLQLTHTAINKSRNAFYWISPSGQVTYVNDYACQSLGYSREELIGKYVCEFDPDFPITAIGPAWDDLKRNGMRIFETRHQRKDGSIFSVEVTSNYISHTGEEHNFCSVQDITERKNAEQELRIAATAFESREGLMITDARKVIIQVNRAFTELSGYSAEEAIGRTPAILKSDRQDAEFYRVLWETISREGHWHGEIWNRHKNGEVCPEWLSISIVRDNEGKITHYIGNFSDISERKAAEEKIRDLAFFDPLTKLPNRRMLADRLQHAFATSARGGTYGAALFIDLDNFKTINDTKGHAVGDLLLIEAADRLQSCVREGDTVARLGGDEFVLVLEDLDSELEVAAAKAKTVGDKILGLLRLPYLLRELEHLGSASIGVSLFGGNDVNTEDLLRRADTAMYEAKKAGRNTLRFFDPAMQKVLEERATLELWMRQGMPHQFSLHYQLQVDIHGHATGAEALLRWQHPDRGLIPPMQFIPLAEETGLILPIGQWVLESACAQLKAWEQQPLRQALVLAVNVSAVQFHQPDFVELVQAAITDSGIDPSRLKLELTESLVLDNVEDAISKMKQLKLSGVSFAMDDFGTGHSSLSYLKRLPLDQLKIDQSFVRDIASDPTDAIIVRTIINMGQTLGMAVIAEGVETEQQLELLREYGCQAFQGYLFGRPVPAEEFKIHLDRQHSQAAHL